VRQADLHRQFAEPQPLQREQVALRDHADQPLLLRDQHVAEAVLHHHQRRFVGGCVARQRERLAHHHPGDRRIDRHVRHRVQQIPLGEDAARPVARVDDDDRADLRLVHASQRSAQRVRLRADDRFATQQPAQWLGERLVLRDQAALE
jgi:hypothetical protein